MDNLQALGLILVTLTSSWTIDRSVAWWIRTGIDGRRHEAEKVLRDHGMEAYTYLASFGAEVGTVRDALTTFDYSGRIVLDAEGNLVGRVIPKVTAGNQGLRLVVDNTNR